MSKLFLSITNMPLPVKGVLDSGQGCSPSDFVFVDIKRDARNDKHLSRRCSHVLTPGGRGCLGCEGGEGGWLKFVCQSSPRKLETQLTSFHQNNHRFGYILVSGSGDNFVTTRCVEREKLLTSHCYNIETE